jgi:DNA polymerase III epsilon subunit-like protein
MEPSHGSRSFQHDRPVAVIDLETTGTDINSDRVVQVAVLTLNADGSEREFESLVNPGIEILAQEVFGKCLVLPSQEAVFSDLPTQLPHAACHARHVSRLEDPRLQHKSALLG